MRVSDVVYAMKLSPEKTTDVSRPHQLRSSPHLSHALLSVTRDSGVWTGILDKCNHAAFWPLSEFSGNPYGWGVSPRPPPLSLSGIPRQGFLHGSTEMEETSIQLFPTFSQGSIFTPLSRTWASPRTGFTNYSGHRVRALL